MEGFCRFGFSADLDCAFVLDQDHRPRTGATEPEVLEMPSLFETSSVALGGYIEGEDAPFAQVDERLGAGRIRTAVHHGVKPPRSVHPVRGGNSILQTQG